MYNIDKGLEFLKIPGLFFVANDVISDLALSNLNEMFNDAMIKQDFNLASLVAEKISILYGVKGLIPYFNVSFLLAQKNKKSHEIIDQDVIKVLSLIFFVEKNYSSESNYKELDEIKEKFISICEKKSKNEIVAEAYNLCQSYVKLDKNSDKIKKYLI